MTDPITPKRRGTLRTVGLAACGVAAMLAVSVAVYGMAGGGRNAGPGAVCAGALDTAKRIEPLIRGEVAALNVATEARLVPNLAFTGPDGAPRTLENWRGRTVLLNLWATWCAPCKQEMPALDELQAQLGSDKFEVVAVNIDTRNLERPKTWLKETKVERLAYYADPAAKTFQELKAFGRAFGMPTTLLIDPQGCEVAALAGPAEWASPEALAVIRSAIGS